MNRETVQILGIFAHLDIFTQAIREMRRLGYNNLTVFSPVPRHEIEEALEGEKSPVRLFALSGGILGG
ncbi:MAG: quinol:electron acceptor oxidoreductase subunit ActD, partial [Candidatus Binatota bacterium]